jgi:chorismate mutase/prephenate dehydratase
MRGCEITIMRNGFLGSILALGVAGIALGQTDQALARQRAKIDALDARIIALLNERARVVQEVGRIKRQAGLAIVDPKRADEVLQRIASNNRGPLPNGNLRRIYERIVEEMTAFEASAMSLK